MLARSILRRLQLVSTPWEAGLNSVAGNVFVLRRMHARYAEFPIVISFESAIRAFRNFYL